MKQSVVLVTVLSLLMMLSPAFAADAPVVVAPAAPAPTPLDVVTLKDGSVLYGEVLEMSNGELHIKTAFGVGEIVKVKWANVAKLAINHPIPFHLKEGSVIVGTATEGENGTIHVQVQPMQSAMTIPLDSITSVNPLVQPPVVYNGSINGGYSQTTGNSHLRNASLLGDFTGRSESLRLTLIGRYVYGEDTGRLLVRNSRGTMKLDFFLTKRFYWFVSSYFEQDTFQDLKLRTSLSTGPGYQFIEKGDYAGPWLKDLTLYAEAGAAYFNEDYNVAGDKSSARSRWSVKLDWPMLDAKMTFYHYEEGFIALQNTKDFYFTADTGLRFKLIGGFTTGFQWTVRYNGIPAPGTSDTDNLYLITLGYAFDTSRKR